MPAGPAWHAVLKDGSNVIEGNNNKFFPDLKQEDIAEFYVLGVKIPQGEWYTFSREAIASPGEQPTVNSISASVFFKGIELKFKFILIAK